MKLIVAITLIIALVCIVTQMKTITAAAFEDSDFAEFEDFDSDDDFLDSATATPIPVAKSTQPDKDKSAGIKESKLAADSKSDFINIADDDDGVVEDDDNEFEHFQDEEEFEGFDAGDAKEVPIDNKMNGEPKLTVAKIPIHFRYI